MEKKIKLSASMKEAIKAMREGYELGVEYGYSAGVWLQHGGCGSGGESKDIKWSTVHAIDDRKLIEVIPGQHIYARPTRYRLSSIGKTINID